MLLGMWTSFPWSQARPESLRVGLTWIPTILDMITVVCVAIACMVALMAGCAHKSQSHWQKGASGA